MTATAASISRAAIAVPAATDLVAAEPVAVRPSVAPVRAAGPTLTHHRFRGTRGLAFVLLGFAGLGVLALGATTSQLVGAMDPASLEPADRIAAATLLRIAPFVMLFGVAQLGSSIAVLRDRPRAMPLGLVAAGLGLALALVLLAAIRSWAGSLVGGLPSSGTATDIQGVLAWTIGVEILAALAIRRVIRGRARP